MTTRQYMDMERDLKAKIKLLKDALWHARLPTVQIEEASTELAPKRVWDPTELS